MFIGFCHDQIDHVMHVVLAFPSCDLPVGPGAFAHDPFNMRHLFLTAQLVHFRGDEIEQLAVQLAPVDFDFVPDYMYGEADSDAFLLEDPTELLFTDYNPLTLDTFVFLFGV